MTSILLINLGISNSIVTAQEDIEATETGTLVEEVIPEGDELEKITDIDSDSIKMMTESAISTDKTKIEEPSAETRSVNSNPKELTGVIVESSSVLYNTAESKNVELVNGKYQLIQGVKYRIGTAFDLSKYNANINNGDWFNINVSAPVTLVDGTEILLTEKDKGIQIGKAIIRSNGPNQGGTVVVTLQDLDVYLQEESGVYDVKGTLWFEFSADQATEEADLSISDGDTGKSWIINVSARKPSNYNNSYNFAKRHGAITPVPYNSTILNKQGKYTHLWTVDVNFGKKAVSTITLSDSIDSNGGPMQFIPETLVVTTGEPNNILNLDGSKVVPESEYTVSYNSSYTAFDLTFHNPSGKAFKVQYRTTSPEDGSEVGNTISATFDGESVPYRDDRTGLTITTKNSSLITQGGTIEAADNAYKIVIYKVDSETRSGLEGAVFEAEKEDGTKVLFPPTDRNGRTVSPKFDVADVNTKVIIKELTPPKGYRKNIETKEVVVTEKGTFTTIVNDKIYQPVSFEIVASKLFTNGTLNGSDFEFELLDENGDVLEKVTNSEDGKIIFTPIQKDEEGTFKYKIREVAGSEQTVTYDKKEIQVTVNVTKNNTDAKLVAEVIYIPENPEFVNEQNITESSSSTTEGSSSTTEGSSSTTEGSSSTTEGSSSTTEPPSGTTEGSSSTTEPPSGTTESLSGTTETTKPTVPIVSEWVTTAETAPITTMIVSEWITSIDSTIEATAELETATITTDSITTMTNRTRKSNLPGTGETSVIIILILSFATLTLGIYFIFPHEKRTIIK